MRASQNTSAPVTACLRCSALWGCTRYSQHSSLCSFTNRFKRDPLLRRQRSLKLQLWRKREGAEMGFIWFWLVAIMLVGYVVLDGFDLGVGVLHLLLTRNDEERQMTIRSIGPVWDGNEVWLLAGGGTLYFAFPLLYASAFSGFYLPLMIVLWLLILRGLSVELRGHSTLGVWRTFFDGVFCFSSTLLIIFYGAALANVIRGVPLGTDSYFFLPLWTNWMVGPNPGILDWYTVIGGVVALTALAVHGALYLAVKTDGELRQRAQTSARRLWPVLVA